MHARGEKIVMLTADVATFAAVAGRGRRMPPGRGLAGHGLPNTVGVSLDAMR